MKRCCSLKRYRRATGCLGRMRVKILGPLSPSRSSAPLGDVTAVWHFQHQESMGSVVRSHGSLFAACQCLIILTSEKARVDQVTHFHGYSGLWYLLGIVRFWVARALCFCGGSWVSASRIVQQRMLVAVAEGKWIGWIIPLAEIYRPISWRVNWWCRLKWKLSLRSSLIWQHENLSPAGKQVSTFRIKKN